MNIFFLRHQILLLTSNPPHPPTLPPRLGTGAMSPSPKPQLDVSPGSDFLRGGGASGGRTKHNFAGWGGGAADDTGSSYLRARSATPTGGGSLGRQPRVSGPSGGAASGGARPQRMAPSPSPSTPGGGMPPRPASTRADISRDTSALYSRDRDRDMPSRSSSRASTLSVASTRSTRSARSSVSSKASSVLPAIGANNSLPRREDPEVRPMTLDNYYHYLPPKVDSFLRDVDFLDWMSKRLFVASLTMTVHIRVVPRHTLRLG
jgi:hypothetical protein